MPSPISPAQIAATVPSASASLCDKIKAVLLRLPALLSQHFSWELDSDGSLSTEFKAEAVSDLYQPGDLKHSAVSTVTTGWLVCNGQEVSRTTYAALFAAIGTSYGSGDGSTTFNVPDYRGRFLMCVSATHLLGATGGSEDHTLTIAEMPAHSHTYTYYNHPGDADNGGANGLDVVSTGTTSSVGGGQAHSILNPYAAVNILIKT